MGDERDDRKCVSQHLVPREGAEYLHQRHCAFLQPLGVQIFTPCASRPHSTSFSSSSSSSSHGVPILPYTPSTERRTVRRTVLLVLPRPKDGDGVGGVPELEVGLEVMELMEDEGVEPDDDGEKEKDGWV